MNSCLPASSLRPLWTILSPSTGASPRVDPTVVSSALTLRRQKQELEAEDVCIRQGYERVVWEMSAGFTHRSLGSNTGTVNRAAAIAAGIPPNVQVLISRSAVIIQCEPRTLSLFLSEGWTQGGSLAPALCALRAPICYGKPGVKRRQGRSGATTQQ